MLQYLQVYRDTKNKILQGDLKPGSMLPTHRNLCDNYSVSINTITKAINRLKKEGYVESFRGLGTVVADLSQRGSEILDKTISIVSYYQHFMQDAVSFAVQDVFSGSDWSIHSRCTHSNLDWYRDALLDCHRNPPAGLILLTMHPTQFTYDEELLPDPATKVVLMNHVIPGKQYDLVRSNSYANGKIMADYLLAKGYDEFVYFSDAKMEEIHASPAIRAMRDVFAPRGIPFGPEQFRRFENPHSYGPRLEPFRDSYDYVKEMLRRERPRVIVAGHDWCAVGAIRAILDSGLSIPDDIAVASTVTSTDLSSFAGVPKITSVDVMFNEEVRAAAETLKARLEGDDTPPIYREYSGRILEGQTA
ncbi:MAG: GntR family transcriptional regulator [Phycisphaerae bacterium]|nr:GntR family transcriptional regulator [Phycisphaerae bacterium]